MIDIFNYTDINANHQTFLTNGSTDTWQSWIKPKGVSFVYITCIGGGGGGGSSPNASGSAGGGGGGGSSSITKILLPSNLIPDILYVQVGTGGNGGTLSSDNATDGRISYVSIQPTTNSFNVIIASGTNGAGAGLRGTTSVGGNGGAGGTVFTNSIGVLSELGIWQSVAGRTGGSGIFQSAGQSVTSIAGGTVLSGGAGGGGRSSGGVAQQGGTILSTGLITFNIPGGAAGGGNGSSGYISIIPNQLTQSSSRFPFIVTGGSGGGANSTFGGGGGLGGDGQIGCGGGGAGAVDGGSPSRIGGRGGDGIVIITSF